MLGVRIPPGLLDTRSEENLWNKLKTFVKGVISELKKVSWASRKELVGATGAVLVLTAIMTLLVFGMDRLFNFLLAQLLKLAR